MTLHKADTEFPNNFKRTSDIIGFLFWNSSDGTNLVSDVDMGQYFRMGLQEQIK